MEVDKRDLCDKIICELECVIHRDGLLQEFSILPVSQNQNKSPVVHVGHNLGLESWCVKHVYSYAYKTVLKIRKLISKRKLLYNEYTHVNRLIIAVLLINPDVSTFWNMRRELVCDKLLEINDELRISKLILTHKSKSNEAFAYRKWLIKRLEESGVMDRAQYFLLWSQEMKVCDRAAKNSPNNYHAWSHRIWLLENIAKYTDTAVILAYELNYTEMWISQHVSEFTGFHYRQYVISRIQTMKIKLDEKYLNYFYETFNTPVPAEDHHCTILFNVLGSTPRSWLDSDVTSFFKELIVLWYDLNLNSELNETFQEHEAIWCHRRYLVHRIFALICSFFGVSLDTSVQNLDLLFAVDKRECNIVENRLLSAPQNQKVFGERCAKVMKYERTVVHSSKLFRILIGKEKALIEKCSKLKNRQSHLAKRYEKWLYFISSVSIV